MSNQHVAGTTKSIGHNDLRQTCDDVSCFIFAMDGVFVCAELAVIAGLVGHVFSSCSTVLY
jgi:hypothetical protein